MGNTESGPSLTENHIRELSEESGFNANKIKRLWIRFCNLDKERKGFLTRDDFLQIPELQNNPVGDRIILAFFPSSSPESKSLGGDSLNSRSIDRVEDGGDDLYDVATFDNFVRVFAKLRPIQKNDAKNKTNKRDDKIKFIFDMFDENKDGIISRQEMFNLLTQMVGEEITQDQLESIAVRMVKEADSDDDHTISFEEFCKVIHEIDIERKLSIRQLN